MKLFAMTAINGDPIPETCLCLDHFDKRSTIHPPIDARPIGWTSQAPEVGLKCIWCGATGDTEARRSDVPTHIETYAQFVKRIADMDLSKVPINSDLEHIINDARMLIAITT